MQIYRKRKREIVSLLAHCSYGHNGQNGTNAKTRSRSFLNWQLYKMLVLQPEA